MDGETRDGCAMHGQSRDIAVQAKAKEGKQNKYKQEKETHSTRFVALDETSPAFRMFWDAYPKKSNLAAAWAIWQQIAPDDNLVGVVLSALAEQRMSEGWLERGGVFVPPPDKYLADRKWEEKIGRRSIGAATVSTPIADRRPIQVQAELSKVNANATFL